MKQSVTLKILRPTHQVSHSIDNLKLKPGIETENLYGFPQMSKHDDSKSVKELKDSMPAEIDIPFGSTEVKTKEDMVQTNFIKFPDSLVNQSKSLQNYTKLPRKHQLNMNMMRRAE